MALLRRLFRARRAFRALPAAALLGVALALSACTGTPYVDSRREAGQREPVGPSTPDMVAICYAGGADAAVKTLADSECAKTNRVPERVLEQRWGCTLTAPRRIFFRCVAKP